MLRFFSKYLIKELYYHISQFVSYFQFMSTILFCVLYKKDMLKMQILGRFSEFYKLMQYLLYHKGLVFLQGVLRMNWTPLTYFFNVIPILD